MTTDNYPKSLLRQLKYNIDSGLIGSRVKRDTLEDIKRVFQREIDVRRWKIYNESRKERTVCTASLLQFPKSENCRAGDRVPISTRDDGSSLFNACSQALFGDKSLARCLRGLTSIELFLHSSYYETHPLIKSPQAIEVYSRSTENALQNIVSDRALKYYKEKCFESLVDAEASIVANDFSSSSFLSMLALSSATDVVIESYYPISTLAGDNESEVESRNGRELLFNSTILPRGSSSSSNTKIHIFRCTSSESKFPENKDYYVPLLQMSEDALETGSGKLGISKCRANDYNRQEPVRASKRTQMKIDAYAFKKAKFDDSASSSQAFTVVSSESEIVDSSKMDNQSIKYTNHNCYKRGLPSPNPQIERTSHRGKVIAGQLLQDEAFNITHTRLSRFDPRELGVNNAGRQMIDGETVDEASTALDEPEESDAFENDDDFNEDDLEALADPDELEALEEADIEEKDPYVVQSIQYYCRFCKICNACKRAGRCSGGLMRKACKHCKYCNPRTYWDLVRRFRIRIRLRRVRLRRWGGRRRRRRRRRG
eukprot:gene1386-15797_t